jgi:hypothetical protein
MFLDHVWHARQGPELVGLLAQTHSRHARCAIVKLSRSLARGTMMIAAGYCVSS